MKSFKNAQRLYIYSGYVFTAFAATGLLLSWFSGPLFTHLAKISSACALAMLIFTLFMIPIALIFDCKAHREERSKIIWLILLVLVLLTLIGLALFLID